MGREVCWKRWDEGANAWEAVASASHAAEPQATLKVVSFNVWFDPHRRRSRLAALVELLADADVVCLQEVRLATLEQLLESTLVRARFCVSAGPEEFAPGSSDYDCLLLVRPHLVRGPVGRFDFQRTQYERCLHIAALAVNGTTVGIATAHLESSAHSVAVREAQVGDVHAIVDEWLDGEGCIFTADCNFCSSQGESHFDPQTTRDTWPALYPDQPGWTEDTDVNAMLLHKRQGASRHVRFDRVLTFGRASTLLEPLSMEILGTQPVVNLLPGDQHNSAYGDLVYIRWASFSPTTTSLFDQFIQMALSDHLGVRATFRVNGKST